MTPGRKAGPVRILLVCTENQCRSPLAAALLRRRFAVDGVTVKVRSAGVRGNGSAVPDTGLALMGNRGIDLSRHRSHPMTVPLLDGADLVIGMARSHVREAVALAPQTWTRGFTFKDLVRRGEVHGPRFPGEPLAGWLTAIGDGRGRTDLLGGSDLDDLPDPMGQPVRVWNRLIDDLERLVDRLVPLLALPADQAVAASAAPADRS